jgi:hypothetical protein
VTEQDIQNRLQLAMKQGAIFLSHKINTKPYNESHGTQTGSDAQCLRAMTSFFTSHFLPSVKGARSRVVG